MTVEEANLTGIAAAHEAFERLTGKKYMLHPARKFAWEKFLVVRKFTVEDIEIVVRYLQGEIAAKRAYPPQLWWNNLIEQPDRFEEYLGEAKAKKRNVVVPATEREKVLEATGRPRLVSMKEVISMNDRVRGYLAEMRKRVNETKTKS